LVFGDFCGPANELTLAAKYIESRKAEGIGEFIMILVVLRWEAPNEGS
jgi:hypothetical protein